MGRTKKTETAETEVRKPVNESEVEVNEQVVKEQVVESTTEEIEEEIPANVLELMRLYSQYQKIWVTSKGFVHPEGAPKYLTEDATLYINKYYNN